ncbi:hypothetical protein [Streptomyces sp. NPDC002746]
MTSVMATTLLLLDACDWGVWLGSPYPDAPQMPSTQASPTASWESGSTSEGDLRVLRRPRSCRE